MISNDKKETISSLGVHDLRNLARVWGVKNPTSKLKKDLIKETIEAMETHPVPPKAPSNGKSIIKGRPTKHGAYKKFVELSVPDLIKEIARARIFHPSQIGVAGNISFGAPLLEDDFAKTLTKYGYVRRLQDAYYFYARSSEEVVYVPSSLIAKHDIEIGDFITTTTSIAFENIYLVESIDEVNGVSIRDGEKRRKLISASSLVALKSPKNIVLDIKEGERNYFAANDYVDFVYEKNELCDELDGRGFVSKAVCVSMNYNDVCNLRNMFGEKNTFLSLKANEPSYSFEVVTDAIYNASILAREGRKVVLFVLGINEIAKEIRKHYSLLQEVNEKEVELHVLQVMRRLLYANKAFKNGGSITLVLVDNEPVCPEF